LDDTKQHLQLLQLKINAYLRAIESGELLENYPAAKDKKVVIGLVMQYWPSPAGHGYLEKAKVFLNANGYDFYYKNESRTTKKINFKEQQEICKKYNAPFVYAPLDLKVGIALNVKDGIQPINGLRHLPEGDTTGWYIWAGEQLSQDSDFFVPLHVLGGIL
jgi:hypothetical protein